MSFEPMAAPASDRSFADLACELGAIVSASEGTAARLAAPAPNAAPPTTTPAVRKPGETYSTTDYGIFRLLPENRKIDQRHVRNLVAQIAQENLLQIRPIDVTTDLGVIDGQHRLEAARVLHYPVFYRIALELNGQHIASLNTTSKNWQGTDYLHHWTVLGEPGYQMLTAFMERHPLISFSNARTMLAANADKNAEDFKVGRYQVYDAQHAEAVATLAELIYTEVAFKYAFDTRFVASLYHCHTEVQGFDPKIFMRKLLHNPKALVRCATHKQYMEMFSGIYNYKTTEVYKVRFLLA